MGYKMKRGSKPKFKKLGSSPAAHYVRDVKEHNEDGHPDDLQTNEEHEKWEADSKKTKKDTPSKFLGGVLGKAAGGAGGASLMGKVGSFFNPLERLKAVREGNIGGALTGGLLMKEDRNKKSNK